MDVWGGIPPHLNWRNYMTIHPIKASGNIMLAFMGLLISFYTQAGVVINGTRVIYPSDAKEITVHITNEGKRAVLVQSWLDTGDKKATPDKITTPFILTPPINRLDASKAQSLRITAANTSALPNDRESLFWLNVLEIPGLPGEKIKEENYLQLAVRSRIKFFWRPTTLKSDVSKAPISLVRSSTPQGLMVRNPTPYYISLTTVTISGKTTEIDMVPPFGSRTFAEAKAKSGSIIECGWIDDYGAIRSHKFSVK